MHTETARGYTLSTEDFPLRGLLVCATRGCRQRLYPQPSLGEPRAYRNSCGCRLRPIDAATIERRVFEEVALRVPALLTADPQPCYTVYQNLLTEVAVGGTVDDVRLVWRN
jgi:hypothetical protein